MENTASLKDQIRAKEIVEGLRRHKTYTQIAEEMELSRPALYAVMEKEQVQELMILEVRELETKLQQWIQELHDSPSPANQRHAVSELGKITKHVTDKVYPSIFRHENINVNIDLTDYLQQIQTHTETISRLPPHMRQQYKQTYEQVQKEYTQ